jgi:prepilin-type N-terminal cleavage/methylation domain-containing protein
MMRRHRGFTLVELMVAMTLSLVIVLAVTQVFRLVGDSVMAGRAVAEMSSQLRAATDQLQRDLGGITVPVRPWADESSGAGYFEAYEGPFWDLGMGPGARVQPLPPAPRTRPLYAESGVGDIDDALMFTAYATGAPFVGQVMASIDNSNPSRPRLYINPSDPTHRTLLESRVAEIAWFTRFNNRNDRDSNDKGQPDRGEVTLHRRVLLVRPDLDLSDASIQALTQVQLYSAFDISVRRLMPTDPWMANSLEDLTKRANRMAHAVLSPNSPPTAPDGSFPVAMSRGLLVPQGSIVTQGPDTQWGVPGVDDDGNGDPNDIREAGHFGSDDLTQPIDVVDPSMAAFGESYGSDLVFADLLAFDVQVYDPNVPVYRSATGSDALVPSDPGYVADGSLTLLGRGAYVDMNYQRYTPNATDMSLFSNPPLPRSGLSGWLTSANTPPATWGLPAYAGVYDTWSMSYERDGIDEDGLLGLDSSGLVDQGTNGIDDDGVNGVDDVGERETSPPYPVPLRGIQVRMRIIDRDTRQVRQMTVSSDFIPE